MQNRSQSTQTLRLVPRPFPISRPFIKLDGDPPPDPHGPGTEHHPENPGDTHYPEQVPPTHPETPQPPVKDCDDHDPGTITDLLRRAA